MKAVRCPSCGAKMKRNGRTGAGAQRWRCGSCGASTTVSYDDTAARLGEFLAWLLSKMGLVTKEFLRKYRRHAIVVLLLLSAVITPSGDPFTLMVVFLPLYLLYELSIRFVKG